MFDDKLTKLQLTPTTRLLQKKLYIKKKAMTWIKIYLCLLQKKYFL